jgi:hypothetical protein
MIEVYIDFAEKFSDLVKDQAEWSQATFGPDDERGPLGALKHLAKEAKEAQEAYMDIGEFSGAFVKFREELADCFLLILDAARRTKIKPLELVEAAQAKMKINRSRTWPKPVSDEPVEHIG